MLDAEARRRGGAEKSNIHRRDAETPRKTKKNGPVELERGASSLWI